MFFRHLCTQKGISLHQHHILQHFCSGMHRNRWTIARVKTKSLGMDWPYVEETRWTCSQEATGVEPTGEAKERNTRAQLATYENGGAGEGKSHME